MEHSNSLFARQKTALPAWGSISSVTLWQTPFCLVSRIRMLTELHFLPKEWISLLSSCPSEHEVLWICGALVCVADAPVSWFLHQCSAIWPISQLVRYANNACNYLRRSSSSVRFCEVLSILNTSWFCPFWKFSTNLSPLRYCGY